MFIFNVFFNFTCCLTSKTVFVFHDSVALFSGPLAPPKKQIPGSQGTHTPYIISSGKSWGKSQTQFSVFVFCLFGISQRSTFFCPTFHSLCFLFLVNLSSLCSLFLWRERKKNCQINRNVTLKIRSLLLYLPIEVPSCLSL